MLSGLSPSGLQPFLFFLETGNMSQFKQKKLEVLRITVCILHVFKCYHCLYNAVNAVLLLLFFNQHSIF